MSTKFSVRCADIAEVSADLLLLKYAQQSYGADGQVAQKLITAGVGSEEAMRPLPGEFTIVAAQGAVRPDHVMFLGTPRLSVFSYGEMRNFARQAVRIVADHASTARHLTTTVHGGGYGLDVIESLQSMIRGFREGLDGHDGQCLEHITFVERSQRTAKILESAMGSAVEGVGPGGGMVREVGRVYAPRPAPPGLAPDRPGGTRGGHGTQKKHVFVAMPYSEDFEDVYQFGIYEPIRKCGFICEKLNESAFTGDIVQRMIERIDTAVVVVADLSESRPNVYLEAGYAWGKGVPVVFLARHGEDVHFDVSTHRCIYYRSIRQLAQDLEKLISGFCDSEKESRR